MSGGTDGRARRMRLLAVLSLLLVFLAGGLVGAAVSRELRDDRRDGRPRVERRGGPPPMFAEGSPIAERLKLTEAQRDSIETLTARDRARADSVFRANRRAMRARFDSTIMAVDAVLTPQQRAEWQTIRREMQARERAERQERRGGRGRRGPGGRDRPLPGEPPSP